jgi:probable HAF family extracellular repeat protein
MSVAPEETPMPARKHVAVGPVHLFLNHAALRFAHIGVALLALGVALPSPAEVAFQTLGSQAVGYGDGSAQAISADGFTIVGQWHHGSHANQSVLWYANTCSLDLGVVDADDLSSSAWDVSADGSVIVGNVRHTSNEREAFRWTRERGMIGLGDLPGGDTNSAAYGVSADGRTVIGASSSNLGDEAFIWDENNGMRGLGMPPGWTSSGATAVSADGTIVVGGGDTPDGSRGFLWTEAGGFTILNLSPVDQGFTSISDMTSNGVHVVGSLHTEDGTEAFIWDAVNGARILGDPPTGNRMSIAFAVSADGQYVVGISRSGSGNERFHAFIWDETHGMRFLKNVLLDQGVDISKWYLQSATDISADGRYIIGTGLAPNGNQQNWVVSLDGSLPPVEVPFHGIGSPMGNEQLSLARGLSADGSTVTGIEINALQTEGFFWSHQAGLQALSSALPQMGLLAPNGINADGSIIVGTASEGPFYWHRDNGLQPLSDVTGGDVFHTVRDVSDNGNVLVGVRQEGQRLRATAFDISSQTVIDLDGIRVFDSDSCATASNADGTAIVGFVRLENDEVRAVLWRGSMWVEHLGTLGTMQNPSRTESYAVAVSADGYTAIGTSTSSEGWRPFFWTPVHGMVGLGTLGVTVSDSHATDVSGDGSRIVGVEHNGTSRVHFLWDPVQGMQYLADLINDDTSCGEFWNGNVESELFISSDGCTISGTGFTPDGPMQAWIATIPPFCHCDTTGETDAPDGRVNIDDFLALLTNWGPCAAPPPGCPWDNTGPDGHRDAQVDHLDFFELLQHWGPCPQ